jgi:hypothetical protein
MPAQAGIQGREGGWIPACAGMTEQIVVIDAQIIAARVFSQEAQRGKAATEERNGRKRRKKDEPMPVIPSEGEEAKIDFSRRSK